MLLAAIGIEARWVRLLNPVAKVDRRADGSLRVQVCTDPLIHITFSPLTLFPNTPEYLVTKTAWPAAAFNLQESPGAVTILTARVKMPHLLFTRMKTTLTTMKREWTRRFPFTGTKRHKR